MRIRPFSQLLLSTAFIATTLLLAGCGTGVVPHTTSPQATHSIIGKVHGGQQPVAGAQLYLYAAANTAGGASTSLLNAPGFVLTDLGGGFNITNDYTCPASGYVYLVAVGGNPGLLLGTNNSRSVLAGGFMSCNALLNTQFITINEISTVGTAYALASLASSATQVGSANPAGLVIASINAGNLASPATGLAQSGFSGAPAAMQPTIDSLANSLAACVNSTGIGGPCAMLSAATGSSADTFQAALYIANNPTANVGTIYGLSTPNAVFQPQLASAPASWSIPLLITSIPGTPPGPAPGASPVVRHAAGSYVTPSFFTGETALGNGVYYLAFPDGNYFGYYSFLSDPDYIYHFDLGYEYVFDAQDGRGGVYFYDFASNHFFYTNPTLFEYLYDFTLQTYLYYYPDSNNPGHYNTNGVRYFYDYATGTVISE